MKKTVVAVFFFFVMIVIGIAGPASAASLSGWISDPTGTPIPYSFVQVWNIDTGGAFTISDEHGQYAVDGLTDGNYEVAVYGGEKYFVYRKEIAIVGDIIADFTLETRPLMIAARFTDGQHQQTIAPEGGEVTYEIEIISNLPKEVKVLWWVTLSGPTGSEYFIKEIVPMPKPVNGRWFPVPSQFPLTPYGTKKGVFELTIPANAAPGWYSIFAQVSITGTAPWGSSSQKTLFLYKEE